LALLSQVALENGVSQLALKTLRQVPQAGPRTASGPARDNSEIDQASLVLASVRAQPPARRIESCIGMSG